MVRFGDKRIGAGAPCFITFEAGPTHSGPESAMCLAEHAARAGADAIKFHFTDPDRIYGDRSTTFTYQVLADREAWTLETVTEPLVDIVARRTLTPDQWRAVKARCDALGLAFFATTVFEDSIGFLSELGCQSIKIASNDVTHLPLIRTAARTGLCIQLDTGNSTLGEIERAVDVVLAEDNENIIIHHCPHGYPAQPQNVNLNIITTLRAMFPFPVAFSDHSPGSHMDVAALTLGADLLEKTITEDKTTRSPEHVFSLEPDEMAGFVRTVRDVEAAFGLHRRIFGPDAAGDRLRLRRGLYLLADGRAGTPVEELASEFRRPHAGGVTPEMLDSMPGARLAEDVPSGSVVTLKHLTWRS